MLRRRLRDNVAQPVTAVLAAALLGVSALALASPESSQASTGVVGIDSGAHVAQLEAQLRASEYERSRLSGELKRQRELAEQANARWQQDRRRLETAKGQRTELLFRLSAAAVDLNRTYDGLIALAAIAQHAQQVAIEATARAAAAVTGTPADDRGLDVAVLGVLLCPVQGEVSVWDSWHAPRPEGRLHEGTDIAAARGAPNVAVQPGVITQGWGRRQGKGVTLQGDNGHVYHYFHLSAYEGAPRRVEVGEVIGYTGDTGNARGGATHTHFEIHPGGGEPVNPYPSVAAVC